MLRSFWRSIDRFSIQHFKYVISELQQIEVVDKHNRELVMDLLQSIVEIVTYGDRQDPLIFECFMEHQVLAEFVRILKISDNSNIQAPLLQYLSIMIQNMDSEHAIFYCFSNGYINNIISHPYKFDGGDLAPYYVSFLRAISGKINRDTLCLLVKVHGDAVVSFPLYTEALRFAQHEEKMIQTAIRSLILNIYNISDDMVYQFILTPPVSEYFSDLVHRLRDLCFRLDAFLYDKGEMETQKRNGLILQSDKIVDELYYFKDILSVGEPRLTRLVSENLLNGLVFPILFSLLALKNNSESAVSAVTSLYIVSRLLQVVGGRSMINNVACVILYHFLNLNVRVLNEGNASNGHDDVKPFSKCLSEVERIICYAPESNEAESIMSSFNNEEICSKRSGILAFVFSEDNSLLLAFIFLLLILAESKDLDCLLSLTIGPYGTRDVMLEINGTPTSKSADGSIFIKFMPEILNALLKVLGLQHSLSAMMLWHVGWCLQKLLNFHREGLNGDNLLLFTTSYDQSRVRFLKELDEIWYDHIPDTLKTEWASCKRVLEQSSQHKDPLFIEYARGMISGNGSTFFEELGLYYIGPVDGHNIEDLVTIFEKVKAMPAPGPVLIHIVTEKGKGYPPAELAADKMHGVVKFDPKTGHQFKPKAPTLSYTQYFAESLIKEAEVDNKIVAIHAAMGGGTGLNYFQKKFPERCFDVGIAEQHAVTFAAGLATEGLKPFCAIYSSFLQRGYDQVVHDVDLQKLPVRFAMDRAGLVGADGPTHCGAFDVAYMACLPNMIVMAPSDEAELMHMVATAAAIDDRPSCFRFPRGNGIGATLPPNNKGTPLEIGKGRILMQGNRVAILGYGSIVQQCQQAAEMLKTQGVYITVADARFCKPLDTVLIRQLAKEHEILITAEEGSIGGFGSHVSQFLSLSGILDGPLKWRAMMLPDRYIEHGSPKDQIEEAGLSSKHIVSTVLSLLERPKEALLFK